MDDLHNVGGGVEFHMSGLAQFTRRVSIILGELPPAAGAELYQIGEEIMTDAKDNYVPVRDGILRGSGFVNPPVIETAQISVTLGFGGAAEAYALVQHEDLSYKHTTGGPKYLERPVLAKAQTIPERIGPIVVGVYHQAAQS